MIRSSSMRAIRLIFSRAIGLVLLEIEWEKCTIIAEVIRWLRAHAHEWPLKYSVGVTSWVCTFIKHGKGRQQILNRDVPALLEAYSFSFEVLETLLGMSAGIYQAQYVYCSLRVSAKIIEKWESTSGMGHCRDWLNFVRATIRQGFTFDLRSMCGILIIYGASLTIPKNRINF